MGSGDPPEVGGGTSRSGAPPQGMCPAAFSSAGTAPLSSASRGLAAHPTGHEALGDLVEIRLHDTPLYNSIYRFDDDMLINTHVYGILAAYTPVLRIRRVDGAYFNTYLESFNQVWAGARPFDSGDNCDKAQDTAT
jgi:hypothetical protein